MQFEWKIRNQNDNSRDADESIDNLGDSDVSYHNTFELCKEIDVKEIVESCVDSSDDEDNKKKSIDSLFHDDREEEIKK